MERDNPDYRLEIIPRWARKFEAYVKCESCGGSGKKFGGFGVWWEEGEDDRCEKCAGRGQMLVKLPPPPPIDPAFLWHMSKAFKEFWDRQPDIQAAYALKKAHEDSLNSAGL